MNFSTKEFSVYIGGYEGEYMFIEAQVCEECDSIVWNTTNHENWHNKLNVQ